ncbi:hypothetical protein BKA83DRAFT_4262087 [Pisolithus microcarpus]|nr:hypothetical protein BKA83DRAFT_4262087 [Pisolithus microcarpus]
MRWPLTRPTRKIPTRYPLLILIKITLLIPAQLKTPLLHRFYHLFRMLMLRTRQTTNSHRQRQRTREMMILILIITMNHRS